MIIRLGAVMKLLLNLGELRFLVHFYILRLLKLRFKLMVNLLNRLFSKSENSFLSVASLLMPFLG